VKYEAALTFAMPFYEYIMVAFCFRKKREIGIWRVVGATKQDIVLELLTEPVTY
jgi:ABC-type lipoprotein release transport system permease subunit